MKTKGKGKKVGAKKPVVEGKKNTYLEMVTCAIATMKDRTGSSRQAITRQIMETHKLEASKVVHIRKAVASGVEKGIIKQAKTSGKGAGSYKIVMKEKAKGDEKPKKPVVRKVTKSKVVEKSLHKKREAQETSC